MQKKETKKKQFEFFRFHFSEKKKKFYHILKKKNWKLPLPPILKGIINEHGEKVRLSYKVHFLLFGEIFKKRNLFSIFFSNFFSKKPEISELHIFSSTKTEKIPCVTIKNVVVEPILGHEEYAIVVCILLCFFAFLLFDFVVNSFFFREFSLGPPKKAGSGFIMFPSNMWKDWSTVFWAQAALHSTDIDLPPN